MFAEVNQRRQPSDDPPQLVLEVRWTLWIIAFSAFIVQRGWVLAMLDPSHPAELHPLAKVSAIDYLIGCSGQPNDVTDSHEIQTTSRPWGRSSVVQ